MPLLTRYETAAIALAKEAALALDVYVSSNTLTVLDREGCSRV